MLSFKVPLVCLFFQLVYIFGVFGKIVSHDQICGSFVGRRIYLELGESGHLTSNNRVTSKNPYSALKQCRLEFVSCPSCIISLKFAFLNISQACAKSQNTHEPCECGYVWIYEPQYKEKSGRKYCNIIGSNNGNPTEVSYKSTTRTVVTALFYNSLYSHSFSMDYSSSRNRVTKQHDPFKGLVNSYTISTPFFPHPYPKDLNMEYVIICQTDGYCKIQLVFDDFLIGRMSVVEFIDWNGQRINATTGMYFRPRTVVSSGPNMTVRFYANEVTGVGFKATYSFITSSNKTNKINMDCGGLVDNPGGGITMMGIVKDEIESFDCVWIIQPARHFADFYTYLRLNVVAFVDFGENTNLLIYNGSTSDQVVYRLMSSQDGPYRENLVTISQGFYIRLIGKVRFESNLAIAYTVFSSNGCTIGTDFSCDNQRCIPIYLQCDGFDHCGDNSDEPTSCYQDLKDRRWFPNFFFPKTEKNNEFSSAALVFVICSFGLISLILALAVLVFRVTGRAHQQREMQNHLQVINDYFDDESRSIIEEEVIGDEPPNYEAPPNYNDVGKVRHMFQESPKQRVSRFANIVRTRSSTIRRHGCGRCSQRGSNSVSHQVVQQSTTQVHIPESPPPAYNSTHAVPQNNGRSVILNQILRQLINEEYSIVKNAILRKCTTRTSLGRVAKDVSFFNERRCLSDSNVTMELKSTIGYPAGNKILKRRYSFNDALL